MKEIEKTKTKKKKTKTKRIPKKYPDSKKS